MYRRRGIKRVAWLAAVMLWNFAAALEIRAQNSNIDGAVIERARAYEPAIRKAAERQGVDARLLWVIAYLETRFNPTLVSRKGARGVMQFMPATAAAYGLSDPHDPLAAIDAAAKYVRDLGERFHRANLVLAAYNAGETTVKAYLAGRSVQVGGQTINPKGLRTGGIPPYRETQEYVERGMKLLSSLPQLNPSPGQDRANQAVKSRNSLVHQSLRADGKRGGVEIVQERPRQTTNRRSIYFGRE